MYRQSSVLGVSLLLLMLLVAPFALLQPARAQFVIASWEYPDDYGQGIYWIRLYENTTGDWEEIEGLYEDYILYNFTESIFDWNATVFIKLSLMSSLNKTLVGVSTRLEGRNYFRHNVTVLDIENNLIFSKENFTYYGQLGTDADPIYYYVYQAILNFVPQYGQTYTVTVSYEVFYGNLPLAGAVAIDTPAEADDTIDANDAGANDMTLLPLAPALNDAYCYAFNSPTLGITVNVGTAGVKNDPPNAVITWQYSKGSNIWANLGGVTDGTNQYSIAGTHDVNWTIPTDWAVDEVGGISGKYWIRSIVTTIGTSWLSAPRGTQAWQSSTWHVIEEPSIIQFFTPLYTASFDALVIFLGLLMIPASTLYLVKGGRDEMTARKFFYFCIAFMLGWGLLLGGITP